MLKPCTKSHLPVSIHSIVGVFDVKIHCCDFKVSWQQQDLCDDSNGSLVDQHCMALLHALLKCKSVLLSKHRRGLGCSHNTLHAAS